MATDFAPYANLRILWNKPAEIADLRSGLPAPTNLVVIEAFLKGDAPTPQELPSLKIGTFTLAGFITRWATLSTGGNWLASGSTFSWNDTGLMPAGLLAQTRGRAFYGDLTALPTITSGSLVGEGTILQVGGSFGVGGIGAELRNATGDPLRLSFATSQ